MTTPFDGPRLSAASCSLRSDWLARRRPWGARRRRPSPGLEGRPLVNLAASTTAAGSDLGAVEHIVFLMMENRSYDHYFGAYPKGRGFDDHPKRSLGVFAQDYPGGSALSPPNVLLPFHLSSSGGSSAPTTSPTTGARSTCAGTTGRWTASSRCTPPRRYEGANGAMTMGYYNRERPALLLRARGRLHPVRRLPLLDTRAHPPQSADGQQRHDRPGRHGGRPGDRYQRDAGRAVELHLAHDAGGAPGRRRLLEGVSPFQRRRLGQIRPIDRVPDVGSRPLQPDR